MAGGEAFAEHEGGLLGRALLGRTPGDVAVDHSRSPRAPVPGSAGTSGRDELRRTGFARYRPEGLDPASGPDAVDLQRISDAFADLPPDPYAPESNRFRRYSHVVYLPWTGEWSWIPGLPDDVHGSVTEYHQDGHNPEYPDVRRRFPDIPEAIRENRLLRQLISADIEQVLWLEALMSTPVWAGVHMIKLAVHDPGEVAASSPNCLHQDGGGSSTFTFAHLVACRNIVGGENVIARPEGAGRQPDDLPPGDVHARFTMVDPLDTYAVHDHRVSHYVSPVRLGDPAAGHGERCILVVGIAPYLPRL